MIGLPDSGPSDMQRNDFYYSSALTIKFRILRAILFISANCYPVSPLLYGKTLPIFSTAVKMHSPRQTLSTVLLFVQSSNLLYFKAPHLNFHPLIISLLFLYRIIAANMTDKCFNSYSGL